MEHVGEIENHRSLVGDQLEPCGSRWFVATRFKTNRVEPDKAQDEVN